MPYKTAVGTTYDSGDFAAVIEQGLALADYDGFKARKKESKKRGLLRGLGVCFVLEHSGGAPIEGLMMNFPGGNTLDLTLNVQSTGQGHATIFPRLVAERLGIPMQQIKHHHGDSRHEVAGYASVGSRSAMTVGHSMVKTIEAILAKGKKVAAAALEAGESDIEYKNGAFNVVGTDRAHLAVRHRGPAAEMKKKGEIPESLDTKLQTETPLTFPNGCHVAEVEIDPQTGRLTLASYTAVDDCGNVLDHMIVEGQTHGAVTMGVGQAMMENTVYDSRRPARLRLVHGLRHAARRRRADVQGRLPPGAGDHQSARRQGRGRSRHHRRDQRGDERDRRRHPGRRRRQDRHAGDARRSCGGRVRQG